VNIEEKKSKCTFIIMALPEWEMLNLPDFLRILFLTLGELFPEEI
jgi:hypothetical protein